MSETAIVDEIIESMNDETAVEPTPVIDDGYLRAWALKLNPFVKLGESPAVSISPNGWLVDVVERYGWDEAETKFPEVGRLLHRLRGTLEELVAGT